MIDDNAVNLELMLYLLRSFGYEAEGRSDGITGFEAAQSGEFALVVTDVLMPGIDGYELARRFKADPQLTRIPLIAVTALAMSGDRERIAEVGFDGYIGKPIEPRKFVAQIASFIPGPEI